MKKIIKRLAAMLLTMVLLCGVFVTPAYANLTLYELVDWKTVLLLLQSIEYDYYDKDTRTYSLSSSKMTQINDFCTAPANYESAARLLASIYYGTASNDKIVVSIVREQAGYFFVKMIDSYEEEYSEDGGSVVSLYTENWWLITETVILLLSGAAVVVLKKKNKVLH